MMNHPELMLSMATQRHHELIAEAEQHRLLVRAREARAARRAGRHRTGHVRGRPAGNLASCDPSAAVPAR